MNPAMMGMPPQSMMPAMPQGMMACPCCGQPMPMPDNSMSAPQQPLPQAQLGLNPMANPQSQLIGALTGGMPY